MTVIERLERLARESHIDRLQHTAGILKHYVSSSPCDEYGNAPDEADFAGFSIQEMHPRDGRDVPAEAQAQFIVATVNALPDLLKLARAVAKADARRDPRHRVSMLANDWQAISAALEPLLREAQP